MAPLNFLDRLNLFQLLNLYVTVEMYSCFVVFYTAFMIQFQPLQLSYNLQE